MIARHHRAGRRRVNAEFVFNRMRAHVVARSVRQYFREQKQRNAFGPRRRIRQAGENEMDDVVGEVMLTVGYEIFDPVI